MGNIPTTTDAVRDNLNDVTPGNFWAYLTSLNIPGLALGTLIGGSLTEIAKAVGDGLVKPVIGSALGLRTGSLKVPKFNLQNILTSTLEFVLTMAAIYIITEILAIEVRKPIQHVYVTTDPGYGSPTPGGL